MSENGPKNRKTMKGYIIPILLMTWLSPTLAQSYMKRADEFSSDSLSRLVLNSSCSVHWTDSSCRYFWYSTATPEGTDYFLVDTKTWKKTKLFDRNGLLIKVNSLAPPCKQVNEIKIWDISFNPKDIDEFTFSLKGQHYKYNIRTGILSETEQAERKGERFNRGDYRKNWSSDSLFYICAYNDDLVLFSTEDSARVAKDSIRLSHDGEHFRSFSLNGYGEKPASGISSPTGRWVGRSHKFFIVREDKRNVGTLSLVDNLAGPRPKTKTYKFPMPGDKDVVQYEAFIADADSGRLYRLDIGRYKDQQIIVPRFSMFPHTDESVWFLRINRTRDTLDLCRADMADHIVRTLITEPCAPHLNEQLFNYHILNGGKEILWWSERTGKGRWYLYDGNGNLKNGIASEDFVCGNIVRIDTTGRKILFEGFGKEKGINPHYRFYYSAGLDGKGKTVLLTPGDGEHEISLSPDGRFVCDTWSRMDMAPRHQICDMNGKVRMELESCDLSALYAKGWKEPEVVEFTAADSITKLYGVVYLPFDIEPGMKYPIISSVYPGPQTDLVPQSFMLDDNYNQSLAQLGFIVVNVSYRGSCPVRGRDFYTHGYGNLRDYALDDDYAVIQQVAERYPFADIDRVGIYGHSGGGFMTVAAMLTRPDFYKVGIAASGNHDNNIYTQWWGETFHGVTRKTGDKGELTFECRIPTNIELASRLNGKLLLITGDMDNNVHPANTFRLAKAFQKAGKRFDMMIIPGADHGLGDKYYINLIRYYFTEHLLGLPQNDTDIINHK